MRTLRLKLVWLLVVPFLWFAAPTGYSILVGAALGLTGLLIRGWAAGTIRKEEELTTTGPYAYLRHPLYLGSLLLGVGITLAGGHEAWVLLFLLFYVTVYTRTMVGEAALLTELFGERYAHYAARVPAFLPSVVPYGPPGVAGDGFTFARYGRNKEWEALAGYVLVFGYFVVRWWLGGGATA